MLSADYPIMSSKKISIKDETIGMDIGAAAEGLIEGQRETILTNKG
jgi:hypothetical protein